MGEEQREDPINVAAELKRLEKGSTRLDAIARLAESQDGKAIGPLVDLLDDKSGDVREAVVQALGAFGEAALAAVSERFWTTDSARARMAALNALAVAGRGGALGAAAHLERIMGDRALPSRIRVATISTLVDLQGENALAQVAELLGEKDLSLRRQAVQCLRSIPLASSTDLLIGLSADADDKVRARALKGLRARYPELLDRLSSGDTGILPVLLAAWRAEEKDDGSADEIGAALVNMGARIVPALVQQLATEEDEADLIAVLARFGPEARVAYDPLVAQLDHRDLATCCAAARALGALGDERAIGPLAACLTFDADLLKAKKHREKQARKRAQALQRAAAAALGQLGRLALPAALAAAARDDPISRQGGALALGRIGGGRALNAVERLVADKSSLVREAAAEALERLAAQDVTRLERMLGNKDARVRRKAVTALSKLDDLRSLDLLLRAYGDPDDQVHQSVVEALARREGERANVVLIAAAAGGNVTALQALQEHPVQRAIPALLEAIDSPWYEVYSAALETVCVYGAAFAGDQEAMAQLRAVIPDLAALLHDDAAKVRRLALRAVEVFRDPTIAEHVADLVLDEKKSVRLEAARVLAVVVGPEAESLLTERLDTVKSASRRETIQEVFEQALAERD